MGIAIGMILLIVFGVIVVGAIITIAVVSARKETVNPVTREGSYFDGNTWQLIGYRILSTLVNTITLGIAYPWMLCMVKGWETKHTVIHGRRLKFNGHGHQLIGQYLLWMFLTIITCGIYGIWFGLGMKKWVVKHTVYADENKPVDSYFSGGAGGYLGIHILWFVLTLFTFGIGKAWADKMVLQWEAKHTHIGGSPLEFNGTGGQLFVKYLLLALLTPITLGIYALFFTVVYMRWQVAHTEAVYQTAQIQAQAKAHELTAVQDFAKYRIAANDQEIAAMKSGYTGNEDEDTLKRMAEEGNPFAAYHLAKQLKGENALYEDKALEWLQTAANGKVHSALLDLAGQSPAEQKVAMLTESAQCGNAQASWLLAVEYKNANDLPQAAYWFKVAMEWGIEQATDGAADYDELVKNIALQLSESRVLPQQSKVLPIVLCVVGVLLLAVVAFVVMSIFGLTPTRGVEDPEPANYQSVSVDTVDVDDIQGQTYSVTDRKGTMEYVIDEEVFFDRDSNLLYLQFGLSDYEETVYLRSSNGWRTETIAAGSGITKVDWPYVTAPSYVEIWAKYDETDGHYIKTHYLKVTEGTTAGANEWLEEKFDDDSQADATTSVASTQSTVKKTESTVSQVVAESSSAAQTVTGLAKDIVGQWESYDAVTSVYNGETILYLNRWTFNADGTVRRVYYECSADVNGSEYYFGKCWSPYDGEAGTGTYTLNGDVLTITSREENGDTYHTTEYDVEYNGTILEVNNKGKMMNFQKIN